MYLFAIVPAGQASGISRWRRPAGLLLVVGAIVLARLGVWEVPEFLRFLLGDWRSLAGDVAQVLVCLFAGVWLHEAGHWVAGRLAGFRLLMVVCGPLSLEARGEGYQLRFDRSAAWLRGLAMMTPVDAKGLAWRSGLYIAGGPLASLAGVAPWWLFPESEWAMVFAMMSGLMGVLNLVPMQEGGLQTDGARLWQLLRGGPAAERLALLLFAGSYLLAPRRFREAPAELLEGLEAGVDDSGDGLSSSYYLYVHAIDEERWADARVHIEHCLRHWEKWPEFRRDVVKLEALYVRASLGLDCRELLPSLEQARPNAFLEEEAIQRVRAATMAAEPALRLLRETLERLRQRPLTAGLEIEADWMQRDLGRREGEAARLPGAEKSEKL